MTITRANIAKQLVPGLNAILGVSYGENSGEHKALFEIKNSVRAFEEQVMMTGFGIAATKPEGSAVDFDDAQETYTARWDMETIALGFQITEEAMEDNLYETKAMFQAQQLGRSMSAAKETKAANVFNLGFSTSRLGGDGQPLFSASHPSVIGVNQSNLITGDLSETGLQDAITRIRRMTDDRGILINAKALSLHVAPENEFTAMQILQTEYTTVNATNSTTGVTNQNQINAIMKGKYFPRGFFTNTRFVDSDAWFVKTDVPLGTIMFNRVKLQTAMEGEFTTGNMRYKARERYAFGWGDWRGFIGSAGS
jgi:hypothetical protein